MAKKTPAAPENAQDSAQKQPEAKIAPQAESASEAGSTLPFAQKRDELIKKFRANAVPREADYKQLLDQHYDVAGALGMANKDDNNGGKTGNGLVFENDKLHVKANASGGLISDANGVSLAAGPSLEIGADNKVNVKISGSNGLTRSADGEVAINAYYNNVDADGVSAAVIVNQDSAIGIWINVGNEGDKKGLKQYRSTSKFGAVLGVSHDNTLKIDSTGKLGINTVQFQVRSVSWPLSATAGDVKLHTDSSLAVNDSGLLGVSKYGAIPKGTIVMFSGKDVPAGWGICDGREINGVRTPNLYNRFIRGGDDVNVNQVGGSDSPDFTPNGTVIVDGHRLTIGEMPKHSHSLRMIATDFFDLNGNDRGFYNAPYNSNYPFVTSNDSAGGDQLHSHTASFIGSAGKVSVIPLYYTLIFIIKL